MARQYEKIVRHNTILPEPITREEFNQLSIEKQKLEHKGLYGKMSEDEWREHDKNIMKN